MLAQKMSHRSEKLEKYIGHCVIIEFKHGKAEKGVLYHNFKGIEGYCLKTPEYEYIFCKSSVRKIKECE